MKNIEITEEGNEIVIRCKKDADFGKSSSGKTNIVASSEGNQTVALRSDGKEIKLGLNLYYKP